MGQAKQQATNQRRIQIAASNALVRAFTPKPGDTFIFTERMVVDCILDGEVWIKHVKADGTVNHFCLPLRQWQKHVRNTMKLGVQFQPI